VDVNICAQALGLHRCAVRDGAAAAPRLGGALPPTTFALVQNRIAVLDIALYAVGASPRRRTRRDATQPPPAR
jgi:hypothetical protein